MKYEPVKDQVERRRIFALIEQCEKKQAMNNLIKREDAIEAVRESKRWHFCDLIPVLSAIKEIPSADRPQGEWIFKTVFPNDKSEFPMGYLVCSVCGSHHSNSTPCNYCDNCGARMTERRER